VSDFKFKKDDVVIHERTGKYCQILSTVVAAPEEHYYVVKPYGQSWPEIFDQGLVDVLYTLKPKYEVGEVYLSADGSKAFLVEAEGRMARLFLDPGLGEVVDHLPRTGRANPVHYERIFGPLIKWKSEL